MDRNPLRKRLLKKDPKAGEATTSSAEGHHEQEEAQGEVQKHCSELLRLEARVEIAKRMPLQGIRTKNRDTLPP